MPRAVTATRRRSWRASASATSASACGRERVTRWAGRDRGRCVGRAGGVSWPGWVRWSPPPRPVAGQDTMDGPDAHGGAVTGGEGFRSLVGQRRENGRPRNRAAPCVEPGGAGGVSVEVGEVRYEAVADVAAFEPVEGLPDPGGRQPTARARRQSRGAGGGLHQCAATRVDRPDRNLADAPDPSPVASGSPRRQRYGSPCPRTPPGRPVPGGHHRLPATRDGSPDHTPRGPLHTTPDSYRPATPRRAGYDRTGPTGTPRNTTFPWSSSRRSRTRSSTPHERLRVGGGVPRSGAGADGAGPPREGRPPGRAADGGVSASPPA